MSDFVGVPPGPVNNPALQVSIAGKLEEAKRIYDDFVGNVTQDIEASLIPARTAVTMAEGIVVGDIQEGIRKARTALVKPVGNVYRDIGSNVDTVHAILGSLGFLPPSAEMRSYALETGDYLYSIGIGEPQFPDKVPPGPEPGTIPEGLLPVESGIASTASLGYVSPITAGSTPYDGTGKRTKEIPILSSWVGWETLDRETCYRVPFELLGEMPPVFMEISRTTDFSIVCWDYRIPTEPVKVSKIDPVPEDAVSGFPGLTKSEIYRGCKITDATTFGKEDGYEWARLLPDGRFVECPIGKPKPPEGMIPPTPEAEIPAGRFDLIESKQKEFVWPGFRGGKIIADLNKANICDEVKECIATINELWEMMKQSLFDRLTWDDFDVPESEVDSVSRWLNRGTKMILEKVRGFVVEFVEGLDDMVQTLSVTIPGQIADGYQYIALRAWIGVINKYISVPFPELEKGIDYMVAYLWQTNVPGQVLINQLLLSGRVEMPEWECLTRLNANQTYWEYLGVYQQRTQPNIGEYVDLLMRELITEEEFDKKMRELGVLEKVEGRRFVQLREALPGVSDIIMFMVRDAANPEIVNNFGMDSGFADNWQGRLAKYGSAQGVTPELAKYYWRSHWKLPSPTQLYEMKHRLRPGRVPGKDEVTDETIRTALKQNDVLPFWIDRLIAISYNPITRTDLQRSYEIDAITEEELTDGYLDIGYSPRDVELLVRFTKQQKDLRRRRKMGLPSGTKIKGWYLEGSIDSATYSEWLRELGFNAQEIIDTLKWADREREIRFRKQEIQCIKKRYISGAEDMGNTISILTRIGVDPSVSDETVKGWCRQRNATGKEVPAANLCKWFEQGLITKPVLMKYLSGLGYGPQEVQLIAGSCEVALEEKQEKELAKRAEKAKREAERAMKDAEKRKEKEEKKAEKAAKEAEKKAKENPPEESPDQA